MKTYLVLFLTFVISQTGFAQLKISFKNLEVVKATIILEIYNTENSFLKADKAFKKYNIEVSGNKAYCNIDTLAVGYYAARAYVDINNNQSLDKNFFGIPSEPYGVSNNAKEQYGPPKYEKAKFYFDGGAMSVEIDVD